LQSNWAFALPHLILENSGIWASVMVEASAASVLCAANSASHVQ